jgi:2-methylcitrate dehydratase PrpD
MADSIGTSTSRTTSILSSYIAECLDNGLPAEVVSKAKLHVLDTLAAMISGSGMEVGKRAVEYIRRSGAVGQTTVVGSNLLAVAAEAALANGMMAHADETDDSHLYGRFHPGCGIIPAALAMAERQQSSGAEFLGAVVLGYDVGTRINLSLGLDPATPPRHSTHSLGTNFGAAAAAAALCRFSPQQVRYVLSYASQQASGIPFWQRDLEHVEKAFDFGGMGARNGVTATAMVAAGFTATDDPFSGRDNFFTAFAESPSPSSLIDALGARFEILRASLKKWCVGSPIQAALDALEHLITEHNLRPDNVESVTVTLPDDRFHIVNDRAMPDICVQHLLGLMLVDGHLTFASCHDYSRMADPDVLSMRKRISALPSRELSIAVPARQAILEVLTTGHETLRHHTRVVRGTPEDPMSVQEVESKARGLILPLLGPDRAERLIHLIGDLESLPSISALRPLLQT